jgi:hypothetical protein
MWFRRVWRGCFALASLLIVAGCSTAGFDQSAYQSAVQLKYETLTLVDQSSGRYAPNKAAVETLMRKYSEAADSASKNSGNVSIVEQWAAIRDPGGTSAGNLFEIWKKAPLRPGQRAEKKRAIAQHFDRLICLEGARQSPTECGEAGAVPDAAPAPKVAAKPAPKRGAAPKPPAADEPALESEPQKE